MTWAEYFWGLVVLLGSMGILAVGVMIWYEIFVRESQEREQ